MGGEAGWWTASGNIGLPPLARVMGVGRQQHCNNLQQDLNQVYDWASTNNMFFNAQKYYYVSFSSNKSFSLSNVFINPEFIIISPSSNVLDLGVYMSSNCTFDFHVANL